MSIENIVVAAAGEREILLTWRDYGRGIDGTVSASVDRVSGLGTLRRLFVRAGKRRGGIGRALVRASLAELKAVGCHRVFVLLNPQDQREEVKAFFEAIGFKGIPGSEFDPPLGSIVMMGEIHGAGLLNSHE
jgi:N-acetylglutamate synthase-like GNAT family acetyltransferase